MRGSSILNHCRSREGKNKSVTSLGNTIIVIGFASSYTAQLHYILHMVELLFLTGSSCPFTRWLFLCRTSHLLLIVPC